jgi:hypothetical protein
MSNILDPMPPERKAEIAPFSPFARFEIPSELKGWEYKEFLFHLAVEMLTRITTDEHVKYTRAFDSKSGEESGIQSCQLRKDNSYFRGCKFYWFDGESEGTPYGWKMGVLFRDHEDMGIYVTDAVFTVADAFAQLLIEKKIPFTLLVRKRDSRGEEIIRSLFPPQEKSADEKRPA